MTTEQWLTVAMVIAVIITAVATALGPVAAVLVQWRISQPKPTPDVNQPKKRSRRIRDWLLSILSSPWLPALFVLVNICLLLVALSRTTPITRLSVFLIAFTIAGIFFNLALAMMLTLIRIVRALFNVATESAQISKELTEIARSLYDSVGRLSDRLFTTKDTPNSLQPVLDETSQDRLDKLQIRIKKLLGE